EIAKERGAEVDGEEIDSEVSADEAVAEGKREDAKRQLVQDRSPATTPQTSIPTSPKLTRLDAPSRQVPETTAERRRRENVLRGLDEASPHGSQKDQSQRS